MFLTTHTKVSWKVVKRATLSGDDNEAILPPCQRLLKNSTKNFWEGAINFGGISVRRGNMYGYEICCEPKQPCLRNSQSLGRTALRIHSQPHAWGKAFAKRSTISHIGWWQLASFSARDPRTDFTASSKVSNSVNTCTIHIWEFKAHLHWQSWTPHPRYSRHAKGQQPIWSLKTPGYSNISNALAFPFTKLLRGTCGMCWM